MEPSGDYPDPFRVTVHRRKQRVCDILIQQLSVHDHTASLGELTISVPRNYTNLIIKCRIGYAVIFCLYKAKNFSIAELRYNF